MLATNLLLFASAAIKSESCQHALVNLSVLIYHNGYDNNAPFVIFVCKDVDECQSDPCGHGKCFNQEGTFICACYSGYSFYNGTCQGDATSMFDRAHASVDDATTTE